MSGPRQPCRKHRLRLQSNGTLVPASKPLRALWYMSGIECRPIKPGEPPVLDLFGRRDSRVWLYPLVLGEILLGLLSWIYLERAEIHDLWQRTWRAHEPPAPALVRPVDPARTS